MERSKPETSKLERSKPEINKQKGEKQAWEQEKQFLDGQKSIEQRDGKQKVGEQQQKQEHQVISVFVENIPKAMHWKGLWHTFARHGDVIGSFIARKLSRGGKMFGFVRMKNRADALRVIEWLNGFMLYGFRLTVNLARPYKEIYKKKNYEMGGINYRKNGLSRADFETGNQRDIPKRISGHVDDEELWRLRRCLVGEMSSVCSTRSIALRLQAWGLGEINVRRMGSKFFLLSFDDDDLYMMLEDLNWSYLKEIFVEIRPWSESLFQPDRVTWLEMSGIPLHCWNHTTVRRVGELWGTFEAFGENIKHDKDCEKVSVLISTSQKKKIEEVIEVKVGGTIFEVSVRELGFSDNSSVGMVVKNDTIKKNTNEDSESTAESVSALEKKLSSDGDRSQSRMEEEALNAMCVDKNFIYCQAQGSEEACYQLGESEQIGGTFEEQPVVVVENLEKQSGAMEKTRGIECDRIVGSSSKGRNWAEVVKKTPHETDDRPSLIQIAKNESQFIEAEKLLYEKAIEDGSNMGCKLTDPNKESWAKEIENKMNTGWGPNTKLSDKSTGTHSEEERDNYFFFQI
ncbi:hypothetical protein V6N13_068843 [Hibiscus sabdariffa]